MKAKIKIEKEVEVKTVLIDISPRYIGDDEDDDMPTTTPMLNEGKTSWVAFVDIDTGKIKDWPEGTSCEFFVKVCDAGTYTLFDDEGCTVAVKEGYVPNGLIPGQYGDYVDLKINEEGIITNWPKTISIDEFFED